MNWLSLLEKLGTTGIITVVLAWLARSLIRSFLAKDLENYKSNLKAQSDTAIEQLKSSLQIEAHKKSIEFSSLHEKRASMIADLYVHLYDIWGLLQRLHFAYQHREIKEDIDRKYLRKNRKEWQLEPGIDTLSPEEEERIKELREETTKFYEFYKRNRIYFSPNICELIDRFATVTSYLPLNYHNVALKDKDGNLLVNPIVKKTWDKAFETIPQLLDIIEVQFRKILGVE